MINPMIGDAKDAKGTQRTQTRQMRKRSFLCGFCFLCVLRVPLRPLRPEIQSAHLRHRLPDARVSALPQEKQRTKDSP